MKIEKAIEIMMKKLGYFWCSECEDWCDDTEDWHNSQLHSKPSNPTP